MAFVKCAECGQHGPPDTMRGWHRSLSGDWCAGEASGSGRTEASGGAVARRILTTPGGEPAFVEAAAWGPLGSVTDEAVAVVAEMACDRRLGVAEVRVCVVDGASGHRVLFGLTVAVYEEEGWTGLSLDQACAARRESVADLIVQTLRSRTTHDPSVWQAVPAGAEVKPAVRKYP